MKNTLLCLLGFIFLSTPLTATAAQSGDFTYTSDGSAITITDYTGPGGTVTIPSTISGLPVSTIGYRAFENKTNLTQVTIPGSITSLGDSLFTFCTSLTNVTILDGLTRIELGMFSNCTNLTSITIPNSVTSIEDSGFAYCISLTNITIPGSITHIGYEAFLECTNLAAVFFTGQTPYVPDPSFGDPNATVYYLPSATGWGATFAGRPARLWNPLMQSSGSSLVVGPTGFGFNITGTADIPIVVEACTNLASAAWVPLQSLNLTNGAFYFNDPNWMNYPARNYRIRSP